MLEVSLFKTSKGTEMIDALEAYNVWNLLRARYISIESFQLLKNFVHDRELEIFIVTMTDAFKEQAKTLEDLAKKFKVKSPKRPPFDISFSEQIESVTDRHVYRGLFSDILAELYSLSRAVRTSITNDDLRSTFIKFFFQHLNGFQSLYKLGKTKDWSDVEPDYKSGRPIKQEPLSTGEANHIWEHLNTRYEQFELTQYFLQFVHDKDLMLLLNEGSSTLKQQIKMLEKLAIQYEVPLPDRPPANKEASIDPQAMEDEFIYRIIFTGIKSALELHSGAVIETIRNDALRNIFIDLLKKELNIYDNIIKYGKLKGWQRVVPMYKK